MSRTNNSTSTLRSLLKAQDEWEDPPRKRQRPLKSTPPPADDRMSENDILQLHVQSVLAVDRCMGQPSASPSSKYRRQVRAAQALLTHSNRSRATVPEPTFHKQAYAKAKKEASLQKIAKLLNKKRGHS